MSSMQLSNIAYAWGSYLFNGQGKSISAVSRPCYVEVRLAEPIVCQSCRMLHIKNFDCLCSVKITGYVVKNEEYKGKRRVMLYFSYMLAYYNKTGQRNFYCGKRKECLSKYIEKFKDLTTIDFKQYKCIVKMQDAEQLNLYFEIKERSKS